MLRERIRIDLRRVAGNERKGSDDAEFSFELAFIEHFEFQSFAIA